MSMLYLAASGLDALDKTADYGRLVRVGNLDDAANDRRGVAGPRVLRDPAGSAAPASDRLDHAAIDQTDRRLLFEQFVEQHSRELGRLAYLMVGDRDAADDLTGDALLAAWRQWDTVRTSDHPIAYVRRVVVNLAATRVRRLVRERRRLILFQADALEVRPGPDSAAVVDIRSALLQLPAGRRACVVLRYALDLPEQEVAALLGVSVGTVKSQTAKGAEQLRKVLRTSDNTIASSLGGTDGTA
jgi:RNA polymerase sigma-70 factor (sigma-E family)